MGLTVPASGVEARPASTPTERRHKNMSRLIPSALSLAEALAGIRPDEDPVIVAGGYDDCDPCNMPFGGRDTGGGPSVGDRAAMPSGDHVYNLLSSLGAQPCRIWGAEPPGQCRDANGCFNGKKVCGAILPYRAAVTPATGYDYTIKAKKWFWPLIWVDSSDTEIMIESLEFQGDSVFENGEGSGALRPSTAFPSDGSNFVPGMPAISSTNGLDFRLIEAAGTDGQLFEGHFVGISIRN